MRPIDRPMRTQIVGPVLGYLRSLGRDPVALLQRLGLPNELEGERDVVLPLAKLYAFLDAAERESGDPFLGLHVAPRLPRGTYDLLEFSCHSAPTVREGLRRVARYVPLINNLVVASFEERDGVGSIEQHIPGAPLCLGRHGNECFVAMMLSRTRRAAGVPVAPVRAWFAHPAPPDTAPLVEALGTSRLDFDAGADGLALPAEVLDLPLVTADPELLAVLDRQADWSLTWHEASADLLAQVRERVLARLRDGAPDLEIVARELGMSARTLQRRLTGGGTSYNEVVDVLRREMAGAYVRDTALPLGEIAARLGYREPGAFLRAFKRWHGVAASQLRRGSAAARGGAS